MTRVFYHIINTCIPNGCKYVFLIYDESTRVFLSSIISACESLNINLSYEEIDTGKRHGEEPPDSIVQKMLSVEAIMCLTKYSLAHTRARLESEKRGIPFLSMPDYNLEMIHNPALLMDYKKAFNEVCIYSERLSGCKEIIVKSEAGTDLHMDVSGRTGNCCPGWVDSTHLLGSPPDIEANISPIETATHGIIVIDGSVTDPRIGLLKTPVNLYVEHGRVDQIVCDDKCLEKTVKEIFEETGSDRAYIVAEFGIGFNSEAKLCGNMLIDEGTKGCVHFGIGSNWTIGGCNRVDFHLDFVMKNANVFLDDECVINNGELNL